jgi:(2Fe-2S) ferredoxin
VLSAVATQRHSGMLQAPESIPQTLGAGNIGAGKRFSYRYHFQHDMQKENNPMAIPKRQIIVCQSFRAAGGDPKGLCHKQTDGFLQYIDEEILDRGMDCLVTATTCLKQCESGPIMVVHPENWWFKGVDSTAAIDAILDGIEDGEPPADYLIAS